MASVSNPYVLPIVMEICGVRSRRPAGPVSRALLSCGATQFAYTKIGPGYVSYRFVLWSCRIKIDPTQQDQLQLKISRGNNTQKHTCSPSGCEDEEVLGVRADNNWCFSSSKHVPSLMLCSWLFSQFIAKAHIWSTGGWVGGISMQRGWQHLWESATEVYSPSLIDQSHLRH